MFINERKRNANTYLISNFDSLEAGPFKSTALGSCLVCLGLNSPLVTGSFPGVKRPESIVHHPPTTSTEVKERVELYIYFPSGPSWPVIGWALPLHLPYSNKSKHIQSRKDEHQMSLEEPLSNRRSATGSLICCTGRYGLTTDLMRLHLKAAISCTLLAPGFCSQNCTTYHRCKQSSYMTDRRNVFMAHLFLRVSNKKRGDFGRTQARK